MEKNNVAVCIAVQLGPTLLRNQHRIGPKSSQRSTPLNIRNTIRPLSLLHHCDQRSCTYSYLLYEFTLHIRQSASNADKKENDSMDEPSAHSNPLI